jgi:PRTRC genetic system protein A
MIQLAEYHVAREDMVPPPPPGKLYTYVFAGNGVFIQAHRRELVARALVSEADVRGLHEIKPSAAFNLPRVSAQLVRAVFNRARGVCVGAGKPREVLFYLIFEADAWRMVEPEQHASGAGVRPADPSDPDCSRAIIELHSHHEMKAFWSGTDDADETGFKLYAVIGRIFSEPRLRVRAGVYGHFVEMNASDVFEIPEDVRPGYEED